MSTSNTTTSGNGNGKASEQPKTESVQWLPTEAIRKAWLGLCKGMAGLKTKIAAIFADAVADCEESTGLEPERCVSIVRTRLLAEAVEAGYAESTANKELTVAAADYRETQLGVERNKKGAGAKVQPIGLQSYRMVLTALDSESGRGANVGDKALRGAAKLLNQLVREEISISDIRAKVRAADKPVAVKAEPKSVQPVNRVAAVVAKS